MPTQLQMSSWWQLGSNIIILVVSSVLVADISIGEETMLLLLTGLSTVIL